jgi:hypothetical protein
MSLGNLRSGPGGQRIAAQTGDEPVFAGPEDFDLELLESRTLDGATRELIYRPTLRTWAAG